MLFAIAIAIALQDTAMQHMHMPADTPEMESQMLMLRTGDFTTMAMAQAFPTYTHMLGKSGVYVTQPAIMANVSNHDASVVLRATLNFESWTQRNGELTGGAWGEGYIDKRHPHTLLHELTLSWNRGTATRGVSLTVGKGFAPYGTDDPMSRPVVKYPTNHHLSQVLERWIASGVFAYRTWGLEAGIFGGDEPSGPNDLSNYNNFGNSWSARLTRRLGASMMGRSPFEISASYASVVEHHATSTQKIRLQNFAFRHEDDHGDMRMYALVEASRSKPDMERAYTSLLGEGSLRWQRSEPYGRIEYSIRPEYRREGLPGESGFYRYDHDGLPIGATRWLSVTGGYGYTVVNRRLSLRPYGELQLNHVKSERGAIDPKALYGSNSFWSISAGARIFLGGDPMRMGTYGVLDPMRAMHEVHAMRDMPGM